MTQPWSDLRAMNRTMTARLLSQPPQPPADPGVALRVLQVTGRRTGAPTRTPLGLLVEGGNWFLVSPDATRDWVLNLRAAGAAVLRGGYESVPVTADELDGTRAAAAVVSYLGLITAPWAVAAFAVPRGAGIEELARDHLHRMAVFSVTPDWNLAVGYSPV
ncbi:MAG TPA: nitroreductase/quinone reductase family protein [Microlunatus sp.]|nr:nitroreductase/quinone reductase family protein [Microlunatus sp.]